MRQPVNQEIPMTLVHEITGDLWTFHTQGEWIAITTNGVIKANGEAVMGAGLAKAAAQRYPDLPRVLGQALRHSGNHPYAFLSTRIITFPTKRHWQHPADLELIIASMKSVAHLIEQHNMSRVYLPRVGCGLGQLSWRDVRTAIAPYLTSRCVFVTSLLETP